MVTPLLSGALTAAGDSVAAAQLAMGARVVPPWSDRMPVDVGAIIALYGIAAGDRGQARTLYVRQQRLYDRAGLWIGAALSQIDRATTLSSNNIDAGVWLVRGRARFTATLATTSTNDQAVFVNTGFTPNPFASAVRVADASLGIEYVREHLDIDATAGARFSVRDIDGSRGFASASLGWRLSRISQIVISGGTQLADPLRGTPQWKFVSAGIRFANLRPPEGIPAGRRGPVVDVVRTDNGMVRVSVATLLAAQQVEITGTLTKWSPVALQRAGDGWEITFAAPPGLHRVQIRVNGGEWRVPINLPAARDEFGGRSGVIVLP
ncbi:MAG TPA: glycogen-binding domain-containing protein [Gemmatimonadaceae bacterium]|nr:glycogen-binding domain-containing protein [Gemmatimonadaceae bacterium]